MAPIINKRFTDGWLLVAGHKKPTTSNKLTESSNQQQVHKRIKPKHRIHRAGLRP
jgi:hypothetical protein